MSFSSSFSVPTVRAIAQLLDEAQLSEISIEVGDETAPQRLIVRREIVFASGETPVVSNAAPQSVTETAAPPAPESNLVLVVSPMVGFFHHAEKPVGEGAIVRAGQVLGVVKTMGIATDVVASIAGRVVESKAIEGQGVGFGQQLFVIEKETQKES